MAKKNKTPLPINVPPPPASFLEPGQEHELGRYLRQVLCQEFDSLNGARFLESQLAGGLAGIKFANERLEQDLDDPMVLKYQQLLDDAESEALTAIDDHVAIFFTAAQLYVRRVEQTVRWFKAHEGDRFGLKADYALARPIRRIGDAIVDGMTIAECVWGLGNYAKHIDEVEGLKDADTIDTTTKLGAYGDGVPRGEAYDRALRKMVGKDTGEADAALGAVVEMLRRWSRGVFETLMDDLDEHEHKERGHTRRENDAIRRAIFKKADG